MALGRTSSPVRIVDSEGLVVTLADGTTFNIAISGVAPQLDDTDKLATSIHGKESGGNGLPGDTAILVNAAGDFMAAAKSELLLR